MNAANLYRAILRVTALSKVRFMYDAANHGSGADQQPPRSPFVMSLEGVSRLSPVLDLTQAEALHESLAEQLSGEAILLDAADVERMSTPCVQLLLAAGRAADSAGHSFRITNASAVFRTAVADLGLQPEFSKWMA